MTQLELATEGKTSDAMRDAASSEHLSAEGLMRRIAAGAVVIPANPLHEALEPMGIGYGLRTKVNANIGTSPTRRDTRAEMEKLCIAIEAGADAVMDLSLGGDLDEIRARIIEQSKVPVGTVPIYQAAIEAGSPEKLDIGKYLEVFERHAGNGVDFATIHAGVTRKGVELAQKRVMPVVSRGGALMAKWMNTNDNESFLYKNFDDVLDIAHEYDITISLGDGLRPGCIADATDEAQLYELKVLGELAQRCREKGVQVMIEGPGHIPLNQIERNIRLEKEICGGAPFYILGPLPTDIAAGYDHIACAIGGALAGMYGADFLCYVTPREHIGLPNAGDVKQGVIAARIAAHIADIAKGVYGSAEDDRSMSDARTRLDWDAMSNYVIDPPMFKEMLREECRSNPEYRKYCSMCGPFCTERRAGV